MTPPEEPARTPSPPVASRDLGDVVRSITRQITHDWRGLEPAVHLLTETAADVLQVERVGVWLYQERRASLRCLDLFVRSRRVHSSGAELEGEDYPRYFEALTREKVIAADDARSDPRTSEFTASYLDLFGIASMLDTPVWAAGRMAGVVCFEHVGDLRPWTEEERAFGTAVGDLCSLILETARHLRADAEAHEGGIRHRRFFEGTLIGLWETDLTGLARRVAELDRRGAGVLEEHLRDDERLWDLVSSIRVRAANRGAIAMFGASSEAEFLERLPGIFREAPECYRDLMRALAADAPSFSIETRVRGLDGTLRDLHMSAALPRDADGLGHVIVNAADITHRRTIERHLEEVATQVSSRTGTDYFEAMVHYLGTRLGADLAFVGELVEGAESVATLAAWRDGPVANFEYALAGTPCADALSNNSCTVPADVSTLYPQDRDLAEMGAQAYVGTPLRGSDGATLGIVVAVFRRPLADPSLTEWLLHILASRAGAEMERLRGEADRMALQAQLIRAQRLESVGRLAGGVAHDFNNLLAPIVAYAELVLESVRDNAEAEEGLRAIYEAGQKASRLTRQLLAFSRRQVLETRPLDVNAVVEGFRGILRTVLREEIDLDLRLDAHLPPALGDDGQIEQALMNLVVNAQDAIAGPGRVTVTTRRRVVTSAQARDMPELKPGAYVELSVADTGQGIDPEVLPHIFEPFFTTKSARDGTGLGLATVYGIVQQHGGAIRVHSTVGEGTEFCVLLPVADGDATAPGADDRSGVPHPAGHECVLVVEDEPAVRLLVVTILRRQGYRVLEAPGPLEALDLLERQGDVDLLLTDVVMPDMNGVELYGVVRERAPHVRVLYMSGYAHDVLAQKGLEGGTGLLDKPFSVAELTRRVREALDS